MLNINSIILVRLVRIEIWEKRSHYGNCNLKNNFKNIFVIFSLEYEILGNPGISANGDALSIYVHNRYTYARIFAHNS